MSRTVKITVSILGGLLLVGLIGVVVCALLSAPARSSGPGPESEATAGPGGAGLPNPASVYCEEQGGKLDIRTAADGSQYGVCIFPDGGECDEWAFYRGECGPEGKAAEPSANVESTVECFDDCMVFARDIALAYVAELYGQAMPAPDAGWTLVTMEESIPAEGSPARIVHRFAAGEWTATVSYEVGALRPVLYTIEIGDVDTGFAWAGTVNTSGQVAE